MTDPSATLTSLLRATSIQDHDEVLKAANAALKVSKSNLQAHHTRVVALLKLDRFDDALRAISEGGNQLENSCLLEKAYALYKSGQLEDAREAVKRASPDRSSRALAHLAAQIDYRAEKFQSAAAAYRSLADEGGGLTGEENDLKINLLATQAQLEWSGLGYQLDERTRQPSRHDLDAFETAYNAACAYIARGDLNRASVLLKRARDLCEASEDLSPDEKGAELLPIMLQHAYVLSLFGKVAEAEALQRLVNPAEISEKPTRIVAQNNQVAIGAGEKNPYLAQRVVGPEALGSSSDKLFEYQASVLKRNLYSLDLQAQKFQGVEKTIRKRIADTPAPTASVEIANLGVMGAAARTHLKTGKEALNMILPLLERHRNDIGLLLTAIQIYVQTRNPAPALTLLESFLKRLETATTQDHQDVRFAPGLVATAVALYRLQGRQNSARSELSKASAYWRSKPQHSSSSLLREAGLELLRSSNPEDIAAAGATFDKLVAQSEDDPAGVAGLVASFATTDYAKVEPYLTTLTPVERLTAGVDAEALIAAGVASAVTTTTTGLDAAGAGAGRKRAADGDPSSRAANNKRRHKKRLPKDHDAGKQPDPERWLPLRDRSTYRPKGKKGKKRAQESTQGGVVREEESLELVGGAGSVKVERAPGGGPGGGGGGGGKKKKRGKK
ncbi:hypothetical protein GGR56DRAFT_111271 [Xylariaceae sp. FL0804]|nr:hypothetical protein GGR56DRAFT_111271 [Xylariaceae sp. FL0804]